MWQAHTACAHAVSTIRPSVPRSQIGLNRQPVRDLTRVSVVRLEVANRTCAPPLLNPVPLPPGRGERARHKGAHFVVRTKITGGSHRVSPAAATAPSVRPGLC